MSSPLLFGPLSSRASLLTSCPESFLALPFGLLEDSLASGDKRAWLGDLDVAHFASQFALLVLMTLILRCGGMDI